MKRTIFRTIYVSIITCLFAVACVIGWACINYDRLPEGIVVIAASFVVFAVSLFLMLTQRSADAKMLEAQSGPFLMKFKGVLSFLRDDEVEREVNGILEFHKYGFFIVEGKDKIYVSYDQVSDIYKEEDLDLFMVIPERVLKIVGDAKMKLMAVEDMLNKQTNYRFDEGAD